MSSHPRIHLLDTLLANQIAAGEVVERPASVVKELLENSLDSGAKKIEIDIENGGMQLIQIRDNGCGIRKDDLVLSLSRHATSKISCLDDLEAVMSLGFRGEALASISSVSRMQLVSRTANEKSAWQINCEGRDNPSTVGPASAPQGTGVSVRDLFFNTPARRKFLRSAKTEFNHIEEVVKRIALSRYDVSFILRHQRRIVLDVKAGEGQLIREKRVGKIFGARFLQQSLAIKNQISGLHITGWLGLPDFSRSQMDLQYFYVNGRMIRDRLINHAIRQAYADKLPPGRHAAYVLYLTLDSRQVDVNVHPTKHEVRFHESRLVHDFIYRSLDEALQTTQAELSAVPDAELASQSMNDKTGHYQGDFATQQSNNYRSTPGASRLGHYQVREQMAAYQSLSKPPQPHSYSSSKHSTTSNSELDPALGNLLGVLHNKYVLIENTQGLLMIDLVGMREHVYLLQLQRDLQASALCSQPLLLPETVTLAEQQIESIAAYQAKLQTLGISVETLGLTTLVVRQLPALLREMPVEGFIQLLAQKLLGVNEQRDLSALLPVLARYAAQHQQDTNLMTIKQLSKQFLPVLEQYPQCWRQFSLSQLDELMNPVEA